MIIIFSYLNGVALRVGWDAGHKLSPAKKAGVTKS